MLALLVSTLTLPAFKAADASCPDPSNVHKSGSGSGYITYDWDDCGCLLNNYKVKYIRKSDGYTSPVYSTSSSNFTFTGLQPGAYTFYFWTDCGGGNISNVIGVDDIGMG